MWISISDCQLINTYCRYSSRGKLNPVNISTMSIDHLNISRFNVNYTSVSSIWVSHMHIRSNLFQICTTRSQRTVYLVGCGEIWSEFNSLYHWISLISIGLLFVFTALILRLHGNVGNVIFEIWNKLPASEIVSSEKLIWCSDVRIDDFLNFWDPSSMFLISLFSWDIPW